MFQTILKTFGHIFDVDVIALEIFFVDHQEAVFDSAISEVVDEQIEPHPSRWADFEEYLRMTSRRHDQDIEPGWRDDAGDIPYARWTSVLTVDTSIQGSQINA